MKKIMLYLFLAALIIAPLSSCNTVEGMGRDMHAAGDTITGAAKNAKGD